MQMLRRSDKDGLPLHQLLAQKAYDTADLVLPAVSYSLEGSMDEGTWMSKSLLQHLADAIYKGLQQHASENH